METLQEKSPNQYIDQELRARNDAETWLAEVLEGRMETEFSYNYDPQTNELYAEDGESLGQIFETAIADAEKLTDANPNLVFELRRRFIEKEEYEEMLAMMQGDINTMVVVSDFPPELMDATSDVGGYNVRRKQTMIRIITKDDHNSLTIKSLSVDRSNRQGLEAIYRHFGIAPKEGELLGQRITQSLDEYQQEFLADNLTFAYDEEMKNQFGGSWKAGRYQPDKPINTYDFVCAQTDLIDYYLQSKNDYSLDQESLQFAIAAEMERRWEGKAQPVVSEYNGAPPQDISKQIWWSAQLARAEGKTFSGCGMSIGAKNELDQAGYGNKTDEKTSYSFNKKQHCVVCQPNAKDDEPKKMCGPCGICKACDAKL